MTKLTQHPLFTQPEILNRKEKTRASNFYKIEMYHVSVTIYIIYQVKTTFNRH